MGSKIVQVGSVLRFLLMVVKIEGQLQYAIGAYRVDAGAMLRVIQFVLATKDHGLYMNTKPLEKMDDTWDLVMYSDAFDVEHPFVFDTSTTFWNLQSFNHFVNTVSFHLFEFFHDRLPPHLLLEWVGMIPSFIKRTRDIEMVFVFSRCQLIHINQCWSTKPIMDQ